MQTFKNKLIAILGLSVEGRDSVKFFQKEGARIWCCDRRSKEELGDTFMELEKIVDGFQFGEDYLYNLGRFDYVVRSPGISLRFSEFLGISLTSSTQLFFDLCSAPIIGVTGTKGKGTTSTLLAKMLEASGKKVWLGGNVGKPLLSEVRHITKNDSVVLELSSFQLEDLKKSPHIAVVLRTTVEHLANADKLASNFHVSRDAYIEAKKNIVRFQTNSDIAILNADDTTSSSFAKETPAHILYFRRFADDAAYLDGEKICTLSQLKLRGRHNLDNISAAALGAKAAGASFASIRSAAISFEGLEHRLESVEIKAGVLYINDSFSTVPETAIAAIESFSQPIILIAGGSEKGSDYSQLGEVIAKNSVKTLIAIGAMAERIVAAAKHARFKGKIITGCATMREIVHVAKQEAEAGDVILLSPACASFDMFANYKERGKEFKHEIVAS